MAHPSNGTSNYNTGKDFNIILISQLLKLYRIRVHKLRH